MISMDMPPPTITPPECRMMVCDVSGTTLSFSYALSQQSRWFSIERKAMLEEGCYVNIAEDMWEYLEYEAARRGLGIEQVYLEETAAERRAREKLPSREELKTLARNSNPDPRYLCADDDPF